MIANVLSIAGSDPSGGAGIQADLKSFAALGAYGMAAITALTAQNTQGVRGFVAMEAGLRHRADRRGVRRRARRCSEDRHGRHRADRPRHRRRAAPAQADNVVLDPVMVATSGDRLLQDDAVAAIRDELVPLARVITPNLPEAAVLTGSAVPASLDAMRTMLPALHQLGCKWVLLKAGHMHSDDRTDLLFDGISIVELPGRRIDTRNTHGTGCSLSSALAALLPRYPVPEAAGRAKAWLTGALAASDRLQVGSGHGPVHHFHALWPKEPLA